MLLQLLERLADSSDGLSDVVIARGVTHAETLWVAKGVTPYCGYMSLLKQVECQVGG